jgi:hypothetical protein
MNEIARSEARLRAAIQRLAVQFHRFRHSLDDRAPQFWIAVGALCKIAADGTRDDLLAACQRAPSVLGTPGDYSRWPLCEIALWQMYVAYNAMVSSQRSVVAGEASDHRPLAADS